MRRINPLVAGLGLLIAIAYAFVSAALAQDFATPAEARSEADILLNEHRNSEAADILLSLHQGNPADTELLADTLSALSRAGRNDEAARMADSLAPEQMPAMVRQAAALAYRLAGRLEKAESLYLALREEQPDNPSIAEGLAMVMLGQNRVTEAERIIREFSTPNQPDAMRGALDMLVQMHRDQAARLADSDRFSEALALLEKIRREHPGHTGVDFDILAVHAWSGHYEEAAELSLSLPLEQAPDHILLAVAMAYRETGRLKQSELLYRDLLARHPDNQAIAEGLALTLIKACNMEQAGQLIDQYRTSRDSMAAAENALVLAMRDRAAALARHGRHDEALDLLRQLRYERFGFPGIDHDILSILSLTGDYTGAAALADQLHLAHAPASARSAAATAYRELGQFDKAETLYLDLLAREPGNADHAAGLAMTAIGKNNLEEAELLLERYGKTDPDAMASVSATLLAARPREPEQPEHVEVQQSQPKPVETAKQTKTPWKPEGLRNGWRQIGPGTTWEDFGVTGTTALSWPEESDDVQDLYELRLDVSWSRTTSGINPVLGSGDAPMLETRLYSKPLADHWRVFGGFATAGGDYDEGHARQNIYLGGIEYRSVLVAAQLEARADTVKHHTKFGLQLSGEISPNKQWSIPFNFELVSRDTPLRARRSGITAKAAGAGLSYAWSETGRFDSRASLLDFSDNNKRLAISADVTQRLSAWMEHYLDGSINGHTSWNSKDAHRPYFNPKHDLEISGALTYGNRLWECDDNSFDHALKLAAGNYFQRDYGSNFVWSLAYSHSWELGRRFALAYGVEYGRHIFDGASERSFTASVSAVFRF